MPLIRRIRRACLQIEAEMDLELDPQNPVADTLIEALTVLRFAADQLQEQARARDEAAAIAKASTATVAAGGAAPDAAIVH